MALPRGVNEAIVWGGRRISNGHGGEMLTLQVCVGEMEEFPSGLLFRWLGWIGVCKGFCYGK